MGFLEDFSKNAVNDYILLHLFNGNRLDIKGSNLDETSVIVSRLVFDVERDWFFEKPSGFSDGEGYILKGTCIEKGKDVYYLLMKKEKSEDAFINELLKEFSTVE